MGITAGDLKRVVDGVVNLSVDGSSSFVHKNELLNRLSLHVS
jgi:hypothetical protein